MKKLALILFVGLIGFSMNAQGTAQATEIDPNAPVFEFESKVIDYGQIEKGSDGEYIFKFKNVGKSPLIISNVIGSCGCTVPTAPKEPIMPGASGEITVKYDTNRVGAISKTITITSNATESKKVIRVKGLVKKESSLSILEKQEKSMVSNKQ
tara:strand:+ start:19722 stop:20180 length:459 start_codon:yes stop_codon:yes gene_type:complete